jgi:beta-galactosidase/beta-glucuronidase
LDGSWNFKGFMEQNGEESGAHLPDYSAHGWLPANVPGAAHLDLMANNVIPDPFKDQNEKKVQWVSDTEWWYRKEVDLSLEVLQHQAVELVFDGLGERYQNRRSQQHVYSMAIQHKKRHLRRQELDCCTV